MSECVSLIVSYDWLLYHYHISTHIKTRFVIKVLHIYNIMRNKIYVYCAVERWGDKFNLGWDGLALNLKSWPENTKCLKKLKYRMLQKHIHIDLFINPQRNNLSP